MPPDPSPSPHADHGLRQLVAASADAMLLADADGRVTLANEAAARLYGRPRPEIEGARLGALLPPLGQDDGVIVRDGRPVPVEVHRVSIDGPHGTIFCITLRDVSARRLAERRDAALLRLSRGAVPGLPAARLFAMVTEEAATLLAAEKSLIGRIDQDGAVVVVGSHGDHRTAVGDRIPGDSGASLVQVARTRNLVRISYADLAEGDPIRALALSQGHHHAVAVPVVVHARTWGALMVASSALIPDDGVRALTRFADVVGTVISASEAHEADAALRASEERFRQLADLVPQLVWTCDAEGLCDFLNHRWEEYTGVPAEEHLGTGWVAAVHPDDRDDIARVWGAAFASRTTFASEYRLRRYDGAYRRFDTRAEPLFDAGGALVRWFGTSTDVEDARAAEAEIRASEGQLRAALDAGSMGAWTFDPVQQRLSVDANVRAIFSIPSEVPDDQVREAMAARVHAADRERVRAGFARALSEPSGVHKDEYRVVGPDGGVRHVETRGRVARGADGQARMFSGIMVDVTDRRLAGERQLRSQKLEALGTLAGGIAHDFNYMLQVVDGNIDLVLTDMAPDDPARGPLGDVERAARRSAELVQRILDFSRPGPDPHSEPVPLAGAVSEALELLRPTIPTMVELRADLPAGLPQVAGDPVGISQVVTNLVTNAAQAIGRRTGVISLALERVAVGPEDALVAQDLEPGAYVRLTVADDGPGMDASTVGRVFDPFFTTKGPGSGTGLGLSIVQTVMRAHRGAVTVSSVPGAGTTFRLYFPVASASAPVAAPPAPARTAAPARSARILFVDDEPDLVALHEKTLGRLGHTVTGHTDPRAALSAFEDDPEAFDAVITDLSMPGMTGLELARAVLARRPGIPVLIASGHIPADERAEAMALGVRDVLPKPSPIAALRDALDAALDQPMDPRTPASRPG